MKRRQETQRLLAGRNEANPIEFASAFNLNTGAAPVPGVNPGREATGQLDASFSQAIQGIGEFAGRHFREAAKTRYERKAMEGAMAYQQGKSIDELDMDGNKWALEGYRVMEAETASTALFAAQQTEISQGLHELDPDGFRARYTERLEQALSGHDERTQELIKQRMMEQMPRLVDQHTREHMAYVENQNFDALTASVSQMSIDPQNSDKLVAFATGQAGSQGLSEARRRAAVIRGIETAYEHNNPLAYSILKQHGVLDDLTMEETRTLRSAAQAFERRKMEEYDEVFFRQRQNLNKAIENGEFSDPHDAVAAYANLLSEHGITINYSAAAAAFGEAMTAGQHHHRALTLEMETARINGDWDTVAEISASFAEAAINQPQGTFYSAMTQFEAGGYDTLFGDSEQGRFPVRVSQMTIGQLKDFSSPSGQYGQWVANSRRDGRTGEVATPMGKFQIVGSTLRRAAEQMGLSDDTVFTPEVQRDIAAHLARQRLARSNTMPGKIEQLRLEWDGFNKASESTMIAIVQELEGTNSVANHKYGDFDNERWTTLVSSFQGDLELAAVAYASKGVGSERAREWDSQGRPDNFLTDKEQAFMRKVTNEVSGHRYVTAQSRAAMAETIYNRVAEANAVDLYAQVEPQLRALDQNFVNGDVSRDEYMQTRRDLYDQFGMRRSIQSVDHELNMISERTRIEEALAAQQGDDALAHSLSEFRIANETRSQQMDQMVQQILDSMPADGVSPEQHRENQLSQIQRVQASFLKAVTADAAERGISFKDSNLEQLIVNAQRDFGQHLDEAQEQAMRRAEIERATLEGRLHKVDNDLARQAYEEENYRSVMSAQRAAAGQSPDQAQQVAAELHQDRMENWFARTGYIPKEIRDRHTAALMGELVQDGDINPLAMDAVQSYMSLKRKNGLAANQMLDEPAQVVAEAIIGLSGGNPEHMPLVMKQLWIEGLEKSFRGEPIQDFMQRSDILRSVRTAIQGTGFNRFVERVTGKPSTEFRALDLPPAEMEAVQQAIMHRIQRMHELVPGMNPKHVVDMAVQQAADTIVAIPRFADATPGEQNLARARGVLGGWADMVVRPGSTNRSISSMLSNPFGNTFVMDPTGGNVREQMFGMSGDSYNTGHVQQAIDSFISSDDFRSREGYDFPIGNYHLTHIGNDQLVIEVEPSRSQRGFFESGAGDSFTTIVPLSEIGEWWKKQDNSKLQQR